MKCSIAGCPGEYEHRLVVQTITRDDQTNVVQNVPAEVCPICGDALLSGETMVSIEKLLVSPPGPVQTVPSFTFPLATASDEPTAN